MPESENQDPSEGNEKLLAELRAQAGKAELVSLTLLAIVSEMVASIDSPYPVTQKRWAGRLLTLLANNPTVQIDGNLRTRLERLREGR